METGEDASSKGFQGPSPGRSLSNCTLGKGEKQEGVTFTLRSVAEGGCACLRACAREEVTVVPRHTLCSRLPASLARRMGCPVVFTVAAAEVTTHGHLENAPGPCSMLHLIPASAQQGKHQTDAKI